MGQDLEQAIAKSEFCFLKESDIIIDSPLSTLLVIGNGFDINHKVRSSYYDFKAWLYPDSELRELLEAYITKADLWADFENNLAYLDIKAIMDSADFMMDLLDVPEANDDDFSAADFFLAKEHMVEPARIIFEELPKKFRAWINSIKLPSTKGHLGNIINPDCKYISFNYTEFLETIYKVKKQNILYIHGCRQNKKAKLIFGHDPALVGNEYDDNKRFSNARMTQTMFDLQENAIFDLASFDMSKDTKQVIKQNKEFFESTASTKKIITVGHSLSSCDYPYFKKLIDVNAFKEPISWYLSFHSVDDLKRINAFVNSMDIPKTQVKLFYI